jgi:peptidoglycan hydrolase-like protein with peptidoglycan-binding domain
MTISGNDFSWAPLAQDVGTHVFTISGRDINGLLADTKITIRVVATNSTPTVVSTPVKTTPAPVATSVNTSVYTFSKNLDTGSKGNEVTELQKKLKLDGYYNGPITGTFGPLTKTAVIKFQKTKKISALGNVGPATRAALNKI